MCRLSKTRRADAVQNKGQNRCIPKETKLGSAWFGKCAAGIPKTD
jgi:hypothetical protein